MPFPFLVVYALRLDDLDRENLGTNPERFSW